MLKVLSSGIFLAPELEGFAMPPEWRKATRNMVMATASMQKASAQIPALAVSGNDSIALILGSISGELETTADFLATWSKTKMARPLLFQNSLHNATTGFASIHVKLTGPSFTVSGRDNTPQECLEMAASLLREKACRVCIVTLVEAHKSLANWIGEEGIREGACTWIVSDEDGCRELGLQARADFNEPFAELNYVSDPQLLPLRAIDTSGFYARAEKWQS